MNEAVLKRMAGFVAKQDKSAGAESVKNPELDSEFSKSQLLSS
jgi:hypothetical protein